MSSTTISARVLAISVVALAASMTACRRPETVAPSVHAPAGEVWLTPEQVKDAKIDVEPLQVHDVDDTILTSGTISLDDLRSGHVFSPVTGRVVSILAALGERVKKGAPLAIIESPDIGTAVADVHKAEADVLTAEHDLKRKKELFEQKAGPAADVEAAQDTYRKAKAELERAQEKERLLRVASSNTVTQQYTLTSPVDGEVLSRNINPGTEIQGQYSGGANQELFTIGELDRVWVMADLYEMDLARVHVGSPASVSVVAYPGKSFKAHVDWVSGTLDPNTRTAKVRLSIENPERLLRPMMYATVQISVDQAKSLAIPRNALLRLGDEKVVFIEVGDVDGHVSFKKVDVDVDEGEASPFLVVKKGLQAGAKLVVNGSILLSQML